MNEPRLLRIAVAAACTVPITAGGAGVLLGASMVGIDSAGAAADSHYRYLSGLLLGVGLLFLTTVPRIETATARFRLLAVIVVVGGIGRLIGIVATGSLRLSPLLALAMELGVTPALVLWQARAARLSRTSGIEP